MLQQWYALDGNAVVPKLRTVVMEFYNTLPVVADLRSPALRERHWEQLHELLQFQVLGTTELTLADLMEKDIKAFALEVNDIASTAKAEGGLETMLDKLVRVWKKLEFEVLSYKDRKNTFIIGSVDDIITVLDESMVTISTSSGPGSVGYQAAGRGLALQAEQIQ